MQNALQYEVKASLKPSSDYGYQFNLMIKNIPIEDLLENNNKHDLLIKRKNKSMKIKVLISLGRLTKSKLRRLDKSYKMGSLKIERSKDGKLITIFYSTEIKSGRIERENSTCTLSITDNSTKYYNIKINYLFPQIMLMKLKKIREKQKQLLTNDNQKVTKASESTVDHFKVAKGIKKTKSLIKNCTKCHFYNKRKCGLYIYPVATDEVCYKFYRPKVKVYLGGGMSSK